MKFKLFFLTFFCLNSAFANIILPAIFSSNMVLQQHTNVKIWGWGKSLEKVKISNTWDNIPETTTVDNNGRWQIDLQTPGFGGPYTLTIEGQNKIELGNVMIGEVWLVSGQSNMEWSANSGVDDAENEIKYANNKNIRFFQVAQLAANFPQQNTQGSWDNCTSETMRKFSAIGYFFAKNINQSLDVPVGIINASWGGTPAEAWTPAHVIENDLILSRNASAMKEDIWGPTKPGKLYNGMINPIAGYGLKGVLWYQGESNVAYAKDYDRLLNAMVSSWRKAWDFKFPFYFVQIAPYNYGKPEEGVLLRNAQRVAEKSIEKAGMVVISDIGNVKDIHPKNKKGVADRLSDLALQKTYDVKTGKSISPKLIGYEAKRGQITLFFDSSDLQCHQCHDNFELADVSGNFVKAKIRIASNTIVLKTDKLDYPIFARFEWNNTAEASIKNSQGMPLSAFVTDNWLGLR